MRFVAPLTEAEKEKLTNLLFHLTGEKPSPLGGIALALELRYSQGKRSAKNGGVSQRCAYGL